MEKIFYKHILSNILVGKNIEDYRDKKALNKFYVRNVNFINDGNLDKNICIVVVKDGIIVKIRDVIYCP